jgi:hypothetical protein
MQNLTLTNNEIPLKALRGLMKEVAIEAKKKAVIADRLLNARIKEELLDLEKRIDGR